LCAARAAGGRTGFDASRSLCATLHNAAADHGDAGAASAAALLQVVVAASWECIACPCLQTASVRSVPGSLVESASLPLSENDVLVSSGLEMSAEVERGSNVPPALMTGERRLGVSREELVRASRLPYRWESAARCSQQATCMAGTNALGVLCLTRQAVCGVQIAALGIGGAAEAEEAARATGGVMIAALRCH